MFNPMEAGKLLAKELAEMKERNARIDAENKVYRMEVLNLLGEIRNHLQCDHNRNCDRNRCAVQQ